MPAFLRAVPARTWILAGLWLGVAALLAWFHAEVIDFGPRQARILQRHDLVLAGTGAAPWVHRVLSPWIAETLSRVLALSGLSRTDAVSAAYAIWRGVALGTVFLLFQRWLRLRFEEPWAWAGTGVLALLHGPSFVHYWFQPDSPVDLAVWAGALVLTEERRDGWLFPLVLAGALNRETAVFAVLLHVALRWGREPSGRLVGRAAGLLATWAVVLAVLHAVVPGSGWAHGSTPAGMLAANFGHPSWFALAAVFLGVLWVAPVLAWRRLPADLKRVCLVSLPYLLLVLAFGRIREVRLLLPLVLVLVPTFLVALGARPSGLEREPGR
ncbi:MAG: hypothetical protein JXB39_13205 [Deltaproteobacteria bacterium]|nr:hypothetical protein [Deltaproteobacteria bacterium]